jgi:DNA-binding response OmpR family regulator
MPKRVLCVDDSPTIRKIVQLCLAEAGIGFTGAANGADAIKAFKKHRPDLVLADVAMPALDGYALCQKLKSGDLGGSVPVVLMVDPFALFDTARAMEVGADGHVAKPFDARTLLAMVGDQLGGEARERALAAIQTTSESAGPRPAAPRSAVPSRASGAGGPIGQLQVDPADLDAIARRVVEMMAPDVVREIAWEVVPDLSELMIREQLQKR